MRIHCSGIGGILCLTRPGAVAAHNLDFLRGKLVPSFTLELHVFHEKGPHVVTEAVSLEMAFEG